MFSTAYLRVSIFSLRNRRTGSLKAIRPADAKFSAQSQMKSKKKKIITSADVQFSAQSQMKSKKKIITSADVWFSAQNQMKSKKKVITSADIQFSAQSPVKSKKKVVPFAGLSLSWNIPKFSWKLDLTCFHCFKMPKRRTFEHYLTSSEDKIFFVKKEDISSKKRTYGNPS